MVEGGEVWCSNGIWYQRRPDGPAVVDPVGQVRGAMYALRRYIGDDSRWTAGHVRWDHLVVFPNSEFSAEFALQECPRWKVVDRTDLDEVVARIDHLLVEQKVARTGIGLGAIAVLAQVLSGRGLPQRDAAAWAFENEDAGDLLTQQQAVILDAVRLLPRVEVRGGAGSGKAFFAVEKAQAH